MTGALTKGSRITGDQRGTLAAAFAERYAGGESIRSIAEDTGRSYGFVHGILKESGATLRGRGGATRGPSRKAMPTLSDPEAPAALPATGPAEAGADEEPALEPARKPEKNGKKGKKKSDKPEAGRGKKNDKKSGRKHHKKG